MISSASQTEMGVKSERTVLDVIDDSSTSTADNDVKPKQGGFNGSKHVSFTSSIVDLLKIFLLFTAKLIQN